MDEFRITGCILGTAVGDALGLPYEGVSTQRLPRLLGPPDRYRFLFGRGMVSDDTEHVCMVAQSLVASEFELGDFTRDFARRLQWWFALLPAGIGRATLRACLKLWFGASPHSSGVFSAGNGPAMRAAIFGAIFDDLGKLTEFVRASTRVTHTDPKAEYGAVAIALAAFFARRESELDGEAFVDQLASLIGPDGEELIALLRGVVRSVSAGESTLQYAAGSGLARGVSGYTYHTVPVAIHAWLSHPKDYRAAVTCMIECGGDADTTAAIVGGIVGTATGETGIPDEWLTSLIEWPRSVGWMRRLAQQLNESLEGSILTKPLRLNAVAVLSRNLLFLIAVLFHGFRRMLPPY